VFFKSLSLLRFDILEASSSEILRLMERELFPVIHTVLPLGEIREGHRILEERLAFGRVVLTPW
jgi:hypothetical protein